MSNALPKLYDENEDLISYPTKRVICPRCDGTGVHDHPAFSNGFTSEEMDEAGPDFREEYMSGRYDVRCEECKGNNVITIPDEEKMSKQTLDLLHEYWASERAYQSICEMERRMGC